MKPNAHKQNDSCWQLSRMQKKDYSPQHSYSNDDARNTWTE